MKGKFIHYSADELAWIEAQKELPRRESHAAFVAAFGRAELSFDNYKALCTRKGWKTGRDGRMQPGNVPFNKDRPCAPGQGGRHPNAVATQFKKGERTGVAVKLYKPIGTERFSKEGYLERKINDDLPLQGRWRGVHRINWEAVNGPVPKGHCLKCLDGNKLNTAASNWQLIPRGVLPILSARYGMDYDQAEGEVKPTIMAVARLKHTIKTKRRGSK